MPPLPRIWVIRCDRCGHTVKKSSKSERALARHLTRLGWYIYGGNSFCPVCKMMARPNDYAGNPKRTKFLHEYPELNIKEGADVPSDVPTTSHAAGARRTSDFEDYRTAIGEEYRAVALYNEMIDDADDEAERKLLEHIRDEELEHLEELKGVSRINPAPNPTVHCPRCEAVVITDFLSKYIIKRGWYMCPQCRYQIKVNPVRAGSLLSIEQSILAVVEHFIDDEIKNFEEWYEHCRGSSPQHRIGSVNPERHILWHLIAILEFADPVSAESVRRQIEENLNLPTGTLTKSNPYE